MSKSLTDRDTGHGEGSVGKPRATSQSGVANAMNTRRYDRTRVTILSLATIMLLSCQKDGGQNEIENIS